VLAAVPAGAETANVAKEDDEAEGVGITALLASGPDGGNTGAVPESGLELAAGGARSMLVVDVPDDAAVGAAVGAATDAAELAPGAARNAALPLKVPAGTK
jgi:hypothetical protein